MFELSKNHTISAGDIDIFRDLFLRGQISVGRAIFPPMNLKLEMDLLSSLDSFESVIF